MEKKEKDREREKERWKKKLLWPLSLKVSGTSLPIAFLLTLLGRLGQVHEDGVGNALC